jgi:hypothetical protein
MLRVARAYVALMLASAACGEDGEADPSMPGQMPGAMQTDTSPATTEPQDATVAAAPQLDAAVSAPQGQDAGSSALDSSVAPAPNAKPDAARPPLVLEVPKASVACGDGPCDTGLDNVCCESWTNGKGFGTSRTCVTRDKCYEMYARDGDQNRAVPHECDGKEDCSGGQVCCMVADSQPLCSIDDIAMCISKLYGPGGSGICADNALCMLGSIQFIAAGVPLGVLACNDDSDCSDRKDTTCQPEQDGSITTGKGIKARSYVKVCR